MTEDLLLRVSKIYPYTLESRCHVHMYYFCISLSGNAALILFNICLLSDDYSLAYDSMMENMR